MVKTLNAQTTCEKSILNLIVGGTVKLSDLFSNPEFDNLERAKIAFSDSTYEDYAATVENDLGEQYIVIAKAKAVYDWSILVDILGEHSSISAAKVSVYEKHKKDLRYLKKLVKENLDTETYKDIFVRTDDKMANYSAYIGMTKKNGRKVPLAGKQCNKADFYAFLKKNVVGRLEGVADIEYLKSEIDQETFMPKQLTKEIGRAHV